MQMEFREQVSGPPAGYRPSIPTTVKLDVVIRQEGKCKACGERLGQLKDTQFDHVPALQLRIWCEEIKDTAPQANDPEFIEAKHKVCHLVKTTGRKGESKFSDTRDGDVPQIARTKRLAKKEEDFRRKLLAKATGEEPPATGAKRKKSWPKRPFPKKPKDAKTRTRNKKGSR